MGNLSLEKRWLNGKEIKPKSSHISGGLLTEERVQMLNTVQEQNYKDFYQICGIVAKFYSCPETYSGMSVQCH